MNLKEYLEANSGKYPQKEDKPELYYWVANQRTRFATNTINRNQKKKLERINFIWDAQEHKWNVMFEWLEFYASQNKYEPVKDTDPELSKWFTSQKYQYVNEIMREDRAKKFKTINFEGGLNEIRWESMYQKLKVFAKDSDIEPTPASDDELYRWYKFQKQQLFKNLLNEEKSLKFSEIRFEGGIIEQKWLERYENVIEFRKTIPDRWPQAKLNKKVPESEIQLGVWCQTMRKRYREGNLSEQWLDRLLAIDFNFDGKNDNWIEYYQRVKVAVDDGTINERGCSNNCVKNFWSYDLDDSKAQL